MFEQRKIHNYLHVCGQTNIKKGITGIQNKQINCSQNAKLSKNFETLLYSRTVACFISRFHKKGSKRVCHEIKVNAHTYTQLSFFTVTFSTHTPLCILFPVICKKHSIVLFFNFLIFWFFVFVLCLCVFMFSFAKHLTQTLLIKNQTNKKTIKQISKSN